MKQFTRKAIAFGAMKEGEHAWLPPEWQSKLPEILESIAGGARPGEVLRRFLPMSSQQQKLRFATRELWEDVKEWNRMIKEMEDRKMVNGFGWWQGGKDLEADEHWNPFMAETSDQVWKAALDFCQGVDLLPKFLAQWEWFAR
jgi:hypothetical protein